PPEIDAGPHEELLREQTAFLRKMLERKSGAYPYALLLGSQTPFEHSTMGEKFIYEAELRTGMGAHFRYAEHLSAALRKFFEQVPEAKAWVEEGTAEPESCCGGGSGSHSGAACLHGRKLSVAD